MTTFVTTVETYKCDVCGFVDEDIMYYRDDKLDLDLCCESCRIGYFGVY